MRKRCQTVTTKLLGLHEHCGGEVNQVSDKGVEYRVCMTCGALGVMATLMSEIFDGDDPTEVTPVPNILDIEIEIVTDDFYEVTGGRR